MALGYAFHMTFYTHRTNYRAWAVGPSNVSDPEKPSWKWLDYLAVHGMSPVQTMFWKPDRSGEVVKAAFGMDYPVICSAEGTPYSVEESFQEGLEAKKFNILQIPESCEQRVSVYIQLKKNAVATQAPTGPSLGLSENSIIILDSMRKKVTRDELLDGALSLRRLMNDVHVKDPLSGNPVLVAVVRLVFGAVADKWSDYILTMQNYIVSVEEIIYSQPANDKYSPLLWNVSKRLLQAERLIKFHRHLIENVQHELTDITGPDTMEPDWLRSIIEEFTRLNSEIEESLRKPVAQMVDLVSPPLRNLR